MTSRDICSTVLILVGNQHVVTDIPINWSLLLDRPAESGIFELFLALLSYLAVLVIGALLLDPLAQLAVSLRRVGSAMLILVRQQQLVLGLPLFRLILPF